MAVLGVMSSSTTNTNMVPGSGSGSSPPTGAKRWYFSEHQLVNTPSLRAGIPLEKELSYRQQAANFIQDMGQRLEVTQLCINTAIVYMQRFFMFHSFDRFHRNSIASASLFLAAKVEEQPRKLEHVIKVAHMCLHRGKAQLDVRSEAYQEQAQELVTNENILLQTLGFDVAIDHPHTHVVKCCQLVKAAKELAQTSYFMATNSLHLTTMCLRYTPTIVACVCIHLACKWSNYGVPLSAQQREWFSYIDAEATHDLLDKLTGEFLAIFDKCPSKLKNKIRDITQSKDDEDSRLSSRRGDCDPTELFNKVGTVPSSAPSKHGRPHHRSHGGQKPPGSGHPGGQPQPHHGSHGHHRSSSSSSSQSGHNAVPAASAPPGASGTGSTGSQHPMQHPISKHPNPAMQFDPNMRSSHREKHMKPGMNSNQAPHNQSLVSSQQLQQQQQRQVQQQRVAVNHGQGGGQPQVDQYGRPVPQQHSGSKNPASTTGNPMHASMSRSQPGGGSSQPGQPQHGLQQPHQQGQHHGQQQRLQNNQQQQQRNMSLPHMQQQQQKSSRSSQQQHRHSSGHDQRSWSQNSKQGHVKQQPGQPQLPPVSASGQPQQPPLPPGGPPLPPGEPPKPAQPPPPPMPPSSGDLRVTSMKPPKSIFDIGSPPASMPAPKSHNSQSSRHHGGHHQQPPASGHLIQQPPPPPITSSTLSQPKVEKLDIGDVFEPDMEDNMTTNSHHTFPTNTHNPVKRERTISETSVGLAGVEEMTGFEKLRDGRSSIKMPKTDPTGGPGGHPGHHHHQQAHGQQQPTKSMVVSIPLPSSTSTGLQASEGVMQPASSSSSSSHKKHKKEKKNKKDKREKGDRKHKSSSSNANGEIVSVSGISVSGQSTGSESGHGHHRSSSSSSKKHKHKHKERDRDSHPHRAVAEVAAPPISAPQAGGLKLKIKPMPDMASSIAPAGDNNVVQPLKLCLGGSTTTTSASSSQSNNQRKRHRQDSDSSYSSI